MGNRWATEPFRQRRTQSSMRFMVSVVVMLVLVLRGLVGTAMAFEAVPCQPVQAQHSGIESPHPTMALPAPQASDCSEPLGSVGSTCENAAQEACSPLGHGPTCPSCGAGHSAPWAPVALLSWPTAPHRAALAPTGPARFASAAVVPAFKPPIG